MSQVDIGCCVMCFEQLCMLLLISSNLIQGLARSSVPHSHQGVASHAGYFGVCRQVLGGGLLSVTPALLP
jgi:hypothetical protein